VIKPDPLDVPFLPAVGELYRIQTIIVQPPDQHNTRPVVIVSCPRDLTGRISFVCRTSDTSAKGIAHSRDRSLGLSKAGVFDRLRSTEAQLWTPRNVAKLGLLESALVSEIIERFWA
jgi:hypothetical protein